MSTVKLQKIGNSFGFRISKGDLETSGFEPDCDYELIAERGVILLIKKRPPVSEWVFDNVDLNEEDKLWLESSLERRISKR